LTHPLRYNEVLSLTTRNYQFTEFGSAFQPASTVVLYKCKCSRFFIVHIPRHAADTTVCCTSDAKNSLGVVPNQKNSFVQFSSAITCLTRVFWRSKIKSVARKLFAYLYSKFYYLWNSTVCNLSSEFTTTIHLITVFSICVVQKSAQRPQMGQAIGHQ